MNAIILTEQQESRLLEMCNKLFPSKSKEFEWEYSLYMPGFLTLEYYDKKIIETMELHWFEFCMTKLWIKISSLLNHKTPEELMSMYNAFWDILNEELHPVDYLYEQFKQLKINK